MNSQETKPVAWSYDLAEWPEGDLHSRGWRPNLSWQLPGFPTMIRNVKPLCFCSQPREPLTDEQMARLFHDTYERLAPSFGYETRPETKAFDPESPNGRLMIAVIHNIRSEG